MAALYANEEQAKSLAEAGARRAGVYQGQRAALPQFDKRGDDPKDQTWRGPRYTGELRAQPIERNGKQLNQLDGYASVTDRPYEMLDWIGPYIEIVEGSAFDETLAAKPDVSFLVNHRGVTMARTTNGTLELEADGLGLKSRAFVNPERQDVRDLIVAVDDKNITEMSFAFFIVEGEWNEDYTEFRIKKVDLDRGDVSAVNYGANPHTSIGARQHELLGDVDRAPEMVARAALQRLQHRTDLAEVPVVGSQTPTVPDDQPPALQGRSVALVTSLLLVDDDE